MQKSLPARFFRQMYSSLTGISTRRDHMKDLRRYLVLKYIQYLVLSSSTAAGTALGLLASAYVLVLLRRANVSSKSTAVLISGLAWADVLAFLGLVFDGISGGSAGSCAALARLLRTANAHGSCALLGAVALEAYLITFLPVESRPLRTVGRARALLGAVWTLVAAECALLLVDERLGAGGASVPAHGPLGVLLRLSGAAAAFVRSLSYILGILLRIANVYIYYKIFFSVSSGSRLKSK